MQLNQEVFKQKLISNFGHEPNIDQQIAIEKLSCFCTEDQDREIFLLGGYAGTGKTSLISALSKTLVDFKWKSILLAPTGRAAKVISSYSNRSAQTIHKKIYKKNLNPDGYISFSLAENSHKNTIFIIDEASMINDSPSEFSTVTILDDILEYVFSGQNCKLIFTGDVAQLPPVGSSFSPALNEDYLRKKYFLNPSVVQLKSVMRQADESGILYNATLLRLQLLNNKTDFPKFSLFKDVIKLDHYDLEDQLNTAYSKYGFENVLVICRSNKRANAYNQQIRHRIKWQENEISAGDLVMAVKNNYFWTEGLAQTEFIANGENLEIERVRNFRELYGFHFAEATISLLDVQDSPSLEVNLLLDTLSSESPSLQYDQLKKLADHIKQENLQSGQFPGYGWLRKNPFYQALQVKFSYAITCHKAQGGQWDCVFIDLGYFTKDMLGEDFLRWMYTAFTRAKEKVFLIGFNDDFFE